MKLIQERVFNSDVHVLIADKGETPLLVAGDYKQLMTVKQAENHWMLNNGYERVGAVNCGFFNMSNGEMLGQCLCDWTNVKASETGWQDGFVDLAFDGSSIKVGDMATFEGCQWVRTLSWGIMKDGVEWTLGRDKYSHDTTYQPRTMIGRTHNNEPIAIVVDGRNMASKLVSGATSTGITVAQQVELAKRYNCKDLVNADGGGSSVMEYKGAIKNNPSDGALRKCSDFVVFYAKKSTDSGSDKDTGSDTSSYTFKQMYLDKTAHNLAYKYGENATLTEITYHQTSNSAPAINERNYLNNRTDKVYVSFHYVVDESTVIQCLPLNVHGWHAGDGQGDGNKKSIGVEIARSTNDDISLRNRAIENGAKFIASLMKTHNIPMSKVKAHRDRSGKNCPHDIVGRYGEAKFRQLIQTEYDKLVSGSNDTTNKDYKVGDYKAYVVTTDELNVRATRNATSNIVAVIPKGTKVYVGYIMYQDNSATPKGSLWGGVSYGGASGFINLDYTLPTSAPSTQEPKPFKLGDYNSKAVTTDSLNVRSARNASATKLGTLAKGTVVTVDYIMYEDNKTTGEVLWGSIYYNNQTGFISLKYCNPA